MAELQSTPAELRAAAAVAGKAKERLTYLFDNGNYTELDAYAAGADLCGAVCAFGKVNGSPCYAFSQEVGRNLGALDSVQAEKISRMLGLAAATGVPVVGIYDSCGADLTDGHRALTAYGELLLKMSGLSGVVPQIAVIAGVCSGTSALLAESADITIIAEGGELYLTPNADAASSADRAAKNGTAAIKAADDKAAAEAAKELLAKLPMNNLSPAPAFEYDAPSGAGAAPEDVLDAGSITELYAGFGAASFTALATLEGRTVGAVKAGKDGAKLTADDCTKIARFVRFCDSFSIPVITFVDTQGFADETEGAVKSMAKLAHAYAEATTAKISVVTGKAYGAAFIALAGRGANADISFLLDTARVTALAPETAAVFLYRDELKGSAKIKDLADRYVAEEGDPYIAAAKGCADGVVSASELRASLAAAAEQLTGKRVSRQPKKHSNIQL